MYLIEAIIHSHRLEAVRESLNEVEVTGLTAVDCRGTGKHGGVTHSFRGSHYAHSFLPSVMVHTVVTEEHLEDAVAAIQKAASSGEFGDGMIFVVPVHEAVRIRTNERGDAALS